MKYLVEYQGGGYSGCFWEWNYCLIGPDSFFQNIHATGSNGIKSLEGMSRYMKRKSKFYVYPINQKGLAEFIRESNAENVLNAVGFINAEIECGAIEGNEIYIECPVCKNDFSEFDCDNGLVLHPPDYQGNGGIGIQYNSYICQECLSSQTCNVCGEWVGDEDSDDWQPYDAEDEIESNYGPLCVYCYESLKKEKEIVKKCKP